MTPRPRRGDVEHAADVTHAHISVELQGIKRGVRCPALCCRKRWHGLLIHTKQARQSPSSTAFSPLLNHALKRLFGAPSSLSSSRLGCAWARASCCEKICHEPPHKVGGTNKQAHEVGVAHDYVTKGVGGWGISWAVSVGTSLRHHGRTKFVSVASHLRRGSFNLLSKILWPGSDVSRDDQSQTPASSVSLANKPHTAVGWIRTQHLTIRWHQAVGQLHDMHWRMGQHLPHRSNLQLRGAGGNMRSGTRYSKVQMALLLSPSPTYDRKRYVSSYVAGWCGSFIQNF